MPNKAMIRVTTADSKYSRTTLFLMEPTCEPSFFVSTVVTSGERSRPLLPGVSLSAVSVVSSCVTKSN